MNYINCTIHVNVEAFNSKSYCERERVREKLEGGFFLGIVT